jgi:hypothetical protein
MGVDVADRCANAIKDSAMVAEHFRRSYETLSRTAAICETTAPEARFADNTSIVIIRELPR